MRNGFTIARISLDGQEIVPRNGFTLIELLVVLCIVTVLIALVMGAVGGFSGAFSGTVFEAEVTDKWTDLDYEGVNKMYRIRTVSPNGNVDTWNSYWCHDDLQVGVSYQFQVSGSYIRKADRLEIQPVKVTTE